MNMNPLLGFVLANQTNIAEEDLKERSNKKVKWKDANIDLRKNDLVSNQGAATTSYKEIVLRESLRAREERQRKVTQVENLKELGEMKIEERKIREYECP
ncbi:unnamed protein product [Lathyrus sativus]|nr:unnamed protein product [Lathyrus sativus]